MSLFLNITNNFKISNMKLKNVYVLRYLELVQNERNGEIKQKEWRKNIWRKLIRKTNF